MRPTADEETMFLRILTLVMALIWGGFIAALFWSRVRDADPIAPCLVRSSSSDQPGAVMFGTRTVAAPCNREESP